MIINIEEIEQLLKDETGYKISKNTSLSEGQIYDYIRGDRKIENMPLSTAMTLQKYINNSKYFLCIQAIYKHFLKINKTISIFSLTTTVKCSIIVYKIEK